MKKTAGIALTLTDIGKKYEIHHERPTLVEKFVNGKNKTFWALRHVNLTVQKGERVGIIGVNGSGKTTLLKIITGITVPTIGHMQAKGKIVSLIDLREGFQPDLSGIDNIFLNGMLLGMRKDELTRKLSSIIRYADIGDFIDVPVRTYSLGMQLRLGFAVAIHANPDIMVFDEGIDVGDNKFKSKIKRDSQKIFRGKTLIMVSHNMYSIADFCDRIIVLNQGRIVNEGGLEMIVYHHKEMEADLMEYLKHKRKTLRFMNEKARYGGS